MLNIFIIPLMYLVIVSLTLWVIISSNAKLLSKLIIIVVAIYLSITIHLSILGLMGYSTTEKPPETFQVLSVTINEPHCIYLLITNDSLKEPRLFSVPYSRGLHQQMQEIGEKMRKGMMVKGGFKKDNASNKRSLSQQEDAPIFYELPPIVPSFKPIN